MESDITVLRGLSKRIDSLLVFDELYVDQLQSISQTLIAQVETSANNQKFLLIKWNVLYIADQK
jgi:ATP-dependent Clp protease ATP-binding subunit ClpA